MFEEGKIYKHRNMRDVCFEVLSVLSEGDEGVGLEVQFLTHSSTSSGMQIGRIDDIVITTEQLGRYREIKF